MRNIWRTVFQHGLYWNDGHIPYCIIDETLEPLRSSNISIIHVKSEQSCKILRELLLNEPHLDIRNIENFGGDFSAEDFSANHKSCGKHKHNTRLCALQNVDLIENLYFQTNHNNNGGQ